MSVGENIRFYRKKAGLTQKQLAKKSNVSEVAIRKYESLNLNPSTNTLIAIANALGANEQDLKAELPKTLGQLIKEARKEAGITQAELADKTGLSISNITKHETGNRIPKISSLKKLSKALDKPISYFYSGYDEQPQEIQQQQEEPSINLKRMSAEEIKQLIVEATNELINRI